MFGDRICLFATVWGLIVEDDGCDGCRRANATEA